MKNRNIPGLMPCPFCGNNTVKINPRPLNICMVVECINCRARGPEIHVQYEKGKDRTEASDLAKKKAAEGWNSNRRTGDSIRAWMDQTACSECGVMFPKDDLYEWDGELVCHDCYREIMEIEEMLR